jgi:hypothetical protein
VLGAGCDGRIASWTSDVVRTAKSCGPDSPTLGSSFAVMIREVMVANKPGTPGRARSSR